MNEWISAKDRLPETIDPVIVCNEISNVYLAWYNYVDNLWRYTYRTEIVTHKITHWMPLPEPPKK